MRVLIRLTAPFGPMFAAEIRRNRVSRMRSYSNWQWHLDEVLVKINGETHYLWRAVDHEGEVLESYVTKRCGVKGNNTYQIVYTGTLMLLWIN